MAEYPNETTKAIVLTPTEFRVLKEAEKGDTSNVIGVTLDLSRRTVDFHLGHIYEKLGVHNRAKAIALAKELGLI